MKNCRRQSTRRTGSAHLGFSAQLCTVLLEPCAMSLQDLISSSKQSARWISESVNDIPLQGTRRNRIGYGLFDQIMDMAVAVCILLEQPMPQRFYGACSTILRSQFEMYVRGLWALHCATDTEIDRIVDIEGDDGRWPHSIRTMAETVESKIDHGKLLTRWITRYWSAMCSYAHGGMRAFGRRSNKEYLEPTVRPGELFEVLRFSTVLGFFACYGVLLLGKRNALASECLDRIASTLKLPAD